MPAYVFEKIAKSAKKSNVNLRADSADSIKWFRQKAKTLTIARNAGPNMMMVMYKNKLTRRPLLGRMYLFQYDPKHKGTLPYYDIFPLVIPFDSVRTDGKAKTENGLGFYGLNLHYLPPILRARLMDAIYSAYLNNPNLDDTTRMKLSYRLLKRVSALKYFKPCVKQYLFNHVRSQFMLISPNEWDISIFLPLDRFIGETRENVWRDSRGMI